MANKVKISDLVLRDALEPSLKSPPNIVMLYYTIMSVFIQGDYVNNWFQNDLEKSFPSC